MNNSISNKITIATTTAIFKAGLIGVLSAEAWYLGLAFADKITESVIQVVHIPLILLSVLAGFVFIIIYLLSRDFFAVTKKILKSGRIDLFFAFVFGVLISVALGGIGAVFYEIILSFLSVKHLLLVASIPFTMGVLVVFRAAQLWWLDKKTERSAPFFLSDVEQKSKDKDLLQFTESADRFAERVLNRGALDSVVFGIDAPWGIGKSTFVNFCEQYWSENNKESVIVYKFNPLRYEGRKNLLEKFIDGLIRAIQDNSFSPEIRPLISKYSRFIRGTKTTFTFPWFNFEVFWGSYTIDDAFNDLESTLSNFDKKIIVVVDDLDRIDFSTIRDILFVIKKSFTLPNISYVLCYDTENISALENRQHDTEKITEFLEKFVNVKVSIFLGNKILSDYISKNLDIALQDNLQMDPQTREKIGQVMDGIKEIYTSPDFHEYLPFLGDVRKLKRIINTLLLFEIEKTDFENSDFNKQDLIHLLLIYLNYPNIFRKIYETETNGKRGFFSVAMPHEDNYPSEPNGQQQGYARDRDYKNSTDYEKYLEKLSDKQQFLLNKVFRVSERLENAAIDSVPQDIKHSYACFNGAWGDGRNLEEYLNLIVKLSKPQRFNQYRFYLNCKNEIRDGKNINDVLNEHEEFSYSQSESSHEQLWRVIVNSLHEFSPEVGARLITYLLQNIQNHSLFTDEKIGAGLRDDIDYFLVKTLDVAGWNDENNQHRNNTEQNIAEIAEWIFGEGRHADNGVVDTLSQENRGVLGLYDTLAFRLFCSADRGGDIFNLSRALSKHSDQDAPTQGSTRDIAVEEMREISQKVIGIFKAQYIDQNRNIFDLINSLSLSDFGGQYTDFINEKISEGMVEDFEQKVEALKSRMKSFITYQLGNSLISSGVGCGYYDETGRADSNGIKTLINGYLFDECFNPARQEINYEHFLDYLLINFASAFSSVNGRDYIPHFGEFTKVLIPERLLEYWRSHRDAIKNMNFDQRNKKIFQGNYRATYMEDLQGVYKVLDDELDKANQATTTQETQSN